MNWISVDERLSQDYEEVLVYIPCESRVGIASRRTLAEIYEYWYCSDNVYSNSEITHWMPLPEPPKEEE